MKRLGWIALLVAAVVAAAFAREFVMPRPGPATAMPLRDQHPDEKMAVAVDPYDTSAKAALFHPKLLDHDVLPVLVVFTNDGDQPVVLNSVSFQLVTRDRAKATPYSLDDLRRALTKLQAPRSRGRDQMPLPLPGRNKPHGGLSQSDQDELEQAMFGARAVEPHATQQGFLFFDVSGLENPADGARLYVTGVKDSRGQELMYFEVPLAK